MIKSSKLIFILLILVIFSSTGDIYRVYVDREFGFFGVRENSTNFTNYENHTLFVNKGDRIEWQNFVTTDERVTLISENKLWNESGAVLGWNYKVFGYTFNKSGTYKVYIKENQIFRLPEDFNRTSDNETKDNNTLPDWFRFQTYVPIRSMKIVVGTNFSNNTIETQKKNKIIALTTVKSQNNIIDDEPYSNEIVPQVTAKIEQKVSPYRKYTILEFLKSIFIKA